jgi:hypothetical protein
VPRAAEFSRFRFAINNFQIRGVQLQSNILCAVMVLAAEQWSRAPMFFGPKPGRPLRPDVIDEATVRKGYWA